MSDLSSRRYIVNNYAHLRYSRYAQHVNMILPSPEHGLLQPVTDTNMRDSFELFLLGDEEKKVTEAIDTRIPSTSIFTFNKEDHTLGNMIRGRLVTNQRVVFAGYKVPHPLFPTFELRVGTDGSITPRAAVLQACRDLVTDLSTLSREFTKEYELRKMVSEGANGSGQNGSL
ncbi:MAG: DNA-directed RNA polymerase II core subunit [Heterodermia speciosa]|uniref:DNA-directed RNA polymerase II core subunit n=1 Tax=Heterodermia speciosa TaxID=116794 RepID=A0A8H3PH43_9LECA|nr:MAG: DNA-directed RNA polymerase II core subunit [Heterodermia speciosa]